MNRALLLDRDGVINREITYLCKIEDFEFIDGVFEASRFFSERGFLVIVVTNQAGIGRGFYTEEDFWKLTDWMEARFADESVKIAKVYFCPFHPTDGVGPYKKESWDRKPNPGMLLRARDDFDLDLGASILVGDKESDILAGVKAGVGKNILVRSGHKISEESEADLIINSLKSLPAALNLA